MSNKTEKNNKLIEKNNATEPAADLVTRKRGRPKGVKNKTIRKDRIDLTSPGENARMLSYSLALSRLPMIDYNNLEQVQARLNEYYDITVQYDSKPAIACLALAFGMSRVNLFDSLNGKSNRIKNPDCIFTIKQAYNIITSQYEQMMNNGKINPVSGIFLMKNNFGYKDNTEYTITTNQDNNVTVNNITERANLLDDI